MIAVWIALLFGVVLGVLMASVYWTRVQLASPPDVELDRYFLKMYCADGHEWFGECIPAVCPWCHKPAIGARS